MGTGEVDAATETGVQRLLPRVVRALALREAEERPAVLGAVGEGPPALFEQAGKLPVVTRAHDVSAESVLSLKPTVVLADTTTGGPRQRW